MRLKEIALNALASGISTVTGLVLLEIITLLLHPQPIIKTGVPDNYYIRYDEDLGWSNLEGARGRERPLPHKDDLIMVRINQHGMRGPELSEKKGKGKSRILFLGDSVTFGYGITEKQRFTDILSERLTDKIELLNLGTIGYGTDQEYLLLQKKGFAFTPDIITLVFQAGDVSDNMNSINSGSSKPYFRMENEKLILKNSPVPERTIFRRHGSTESKIKNILYTHSHLYRLIFHRLVNSSNLMHDSVKEMSREEGIRVTMNLLKKIDQLCKINHCRFLVLLIPHETFVMEGVATGDTNVAYFPLIKTLMSSIGIEFVDSSTELIKHVKMGEKVFIEKDPVHLNKRGNEIVADLLYNAMQSKRYIMGPNN